MSGAAKICVCMLALALGWQAAPARAADDIISWREAHKHLGKTVVVEGTIVATRDTGGICFLNFDRDYRTYVSGVIFQRDVAKFDAAPERMYKGKRVRLRGTVSEHQGRPQIVVSHPNQIEIVDTTPDVDARPVAALVAPATGAWPVISWEDADRYLGRDAIVEGKVIATFNSGKAIFLNFHRNYRRYVSVVIFADHAHRFPRPPEELYDDRMVRVRGYVEEYQGRPQIVVHGPDQIEFIDGLSVARPFVPEAAIQQATATGDPRVDGLIDLLHNRGVLSDEDTRALREMGR